MILFFSNFNTPLKVSIHPPSNSTKISTNWNRLPPPSFQESILLFLPSRSSTLVMTQHRSRRNLPSPFFPIGTTSRMMHRSLRSARHRRNNANKPITSILRNRRLRVGEWCGAERCRAKERERERKESKERKSTIGGRGGGEAMRERRERERRWARNIGTECMHDALGNDIDIMAEPTK